MGFKTMLVHVDTGRSASARLKFSADLAARFSAHVTGLYVRRPFQAPAFTDAGPAMDSLYRTYENAAKADEAAATAAFRELIGGTGLSSDWQVTDGLAEEAVAAHARYADLVIVGQGEPDAPATTTPADLAETVAISGERPVLIVPHIGVTKPPGKTVLLCWNGTREAARAATGALPILKQADKVIILLIDPKSDGDEQPGLDVTRWLVRHGAGRPGPSAHGGPESGCETRLAAARDGFGAGSGGDGSGDGRIATATASPTCAAAAKQEPPAESRIGVCE